MRPSLNILSDELIARITGWLTGPAPVGEIRGAD